MKLIILVAAIIMVFGVFGSYRIAEATPVIFSETFLGGKYDANYFDLHETWKARFAFDLTGWGDTAKLYDGSDALQDTKYPTNDERAYKVDKFYPPFLAGLNFTFSSEDARREAVKIRAGFYDGNTLITEKIYDLGYWAQGEGYVREYADLHINLDNEGLLSYLADGKFVSFVIAPDNNLAWENDIRIDRANLTAKANPIPEPASLSLLGLGLLGLVGLRKKKIR
jgi:hypothetical protein